MGFRINTNVAAMNAHRNATQTNMGLDKSLNSLSSGLRINKAADDASGMTIADSLRSQAQGLGQAINNANDGVAVTQTADGALNEYINIINTVRTKAIQAASDGQNKASRGAIQKDINRLLQAADNISTQTQFNGQKLLDGSFINKAFHVGAYAQETTNLSVASVRVADVGGVSSGVDNGSIDATLLSSGSQSINKKVDNTYALLNNSLKVNGKDVTATLTANNQFDVLDAKNIAQAISDATGIVATAETKQTGTKAVSAFTITAGSANTMKINGVDLGSLTVTTGDGTGALTVAINAVSDQTGVTATRSTAGALTLTAADGRNIVVDTAGNSTKSNLADKTTLMSGATNKVISQASTTSLTIAAGVLIINGVDMKGTYGDGATAGLAGDDLQAAIRKISGMKTSVVQNDGSIDLYRNDGGDLNVVSTDSTLLSAKKVGLRNNSTHGNVTLYSDTSVNVEKNAKGANLGYKTGSISVSKGAARLDTVDVTSRSAAEKSILMADSALKQLDATRSDLGSVQNQLQSTIRNISVTQVNVTAAESQIRDVDFAKESANFAKLNILAQSGSYAMSQANTVQKNVLRLLQ